VFELEKRWPGGQIVSCGRSGKCSKCEHFGHLLNKSATFCGMLFICSYQSHGWWPVYANKSQTCGDVYCFVVKEMFTTVEHNYYLPTKSPKVFHKTHFFWAFMGKLTILNIAKSWGIYHPTFE
jgi:hypothetical protein